MEHRDEQFPVPSPDGDAADGLMRVPSGTPGGAEPEAGDPAVPTSDTGAGREPAPVVARPESATRREGSRGAHRAKVSWAGRTAQGGQDARRGWLGRITHAVTDEPASRREDPTAGGSPADSLGPVENQPVVAPGPDPAVTSNGARAASGEAGQSGAEVPLTVAVADPRDEVVFVPARPSEGQPTAPAASRRSPIIATATGVGIGAVTLVCFLAGTAAVLVLSSVVLAVAMTECYRALQRARYRPAAALGLLAAPGAAIAAYFGGPLGLCLVGAGMVVASFCWFLLGVTRHSPVVNLGVTLMGWVWIGLLGGFAGLLLDPAVFPHRAGLAFFLGAVEATVAYDVGGYLFGSWLGKRPMVPRISPKKTWEGLIGGCLAAFAVAVAVASQMSPWSYGRGALLGVVVVVVAPIGDLAESMVKRDLRLKDMGSLLPAHGGALDRIDALLFVLPATYCLVRLLHW
jgi:CDP-diglyceride synthetase